MNDKCPINEKYITKGWQTYFLILAVVNGIILGVDLGLHAWGWATLAVICSLYSIWMHDQIRDELKKREED